jgi:hypothetical protein
MKILEKKWPVMMKATLFEYCIVDPPKKIDKLDEGF